MALEYLGEADRANRFFSTVLHETLDDATLNRLYCPEVRQYQREERGAVVILTYEQRQPGEANWQPVRLVRRI